MSGKTEWEDALIKHGIIQAPPEKPDEDELHMEHVERVQARDVLDEKNLDQLKALEDEVEEDVLESYRKKRIAELQAQQAKNKYGELNQIGEQEFMAEVSKADPEVFVVLHLFVHGKVECQLMNKCLTTLAHKFRYVKFLKIVSKECIHNYPDANCPTLLIYKKGEIVTQHVGLGIFGGLKMNSDTLEWVLAAGGILKTELEEDPREGLVQTKISRGGLSRSNRYSDDEADEADD